LTNVFGASTKDSIQTLSEIQVKHRLSIVLCFVLFSSLRSFCQ